AEVRDGSDINEVAELSQDQTIVSGIEGASIDARRVCGSPYIEAVTGTGAPDIAAFHRERRPHEHVGLLISKRHDALAEPVVPIGAGITDNIRANPFQAQPYVRINGCSGVVGLPTRRRGGLCQTSILL